MRSERCQRQRPTASTIGWMETLRKMVFAQAVWQICEPAYAKAARGGRPGIDPVVYLKMLMVGFFEDLPSERAVASRCADSFSIRGFLGYELTQPRRITPA